MAKLFEWLLFNQFRKLFLVNKPQKELKFIWQGQQHFRLIFIVNINSRKKLIKLFRFILVRVNLNRQALFYWKDFEQKLKVIHSIGS